MPGLDDGSCTSPAPSLSRNEDGDTGNSGNVGATSSVQPPSYDDVTGNMNYLRGIADNLSL